MVVDEMESDNENVCHMRHGKSFLQEFTFTVTAIFSYTANCKYMTCYSMSSNCK